MKAHKIHAIESLNTLDTDFKTEAIVAGLVENGQDEDKVVIVRKRGNKRNVSKDIHKVEYIYSNHDLLEYLYVFTNRSGIYDSLPEGIFHQPESSMRQSDAEDIISKIRSQRVEENQARHFFQPFEIAIDQVLVGAQLYEQKFDKAHIHDNLRQIFMEQWHILQFMTLQQALLFIRIIPSIPEILQSYSQMATAIGIILGCPVSIREGRKSKLNLSSDEKTGLGRCKLGVNFILGRSVVNSLPDLDITIGPINTEEMKSFQSNGSNKQILIRLIDMFVPFDRNKNINYKLSDTNTKFRLSGEGHTTYLGINTKL